MGKDTKQPTTTKTNLPPRGHSSTTSANSTNSHFRSTSRIHPQPQTTHRDRKFQSPHTKPSFCNDPSRPPSSSARDSLPLQLLLITSSPLSILGSHHTHTLRCEEAK